MNIFVESSHMDEVENALSKLDNLEEMFEVTGEFDIVALVSATDTQEFRHILKTKIANIEGVKGTVSSVILKDTKYKTRMTVPIAANQRLLNPEIRARLR